MFILSTNSYFSVFLLLTSLFSAIISAENDQLISDICKQATNPSLCSKSLTSDPRSLRSDLQALGLIAIEKTQASANSTRELINSLKDSITNHRVKEIYDTCLQTYDDAIDGLISSKEFLGSKDFKSLNVYASAVITDATTCDSGFMDEGVDEPPEIVQAGQELKDLADVILVISHKLAGE